VRQAVCGAACVKEATHDAHDSVEWGPGWVLRELGISAVHGQARGRRHVPPPRPV
jgi:hypothetical protein